nr:cubilin-like [Pseudochaenichthys georgianus]
MYGFHTDTEWRKTWLAQSSTGCGGYMSMPIGRFGSPDPNLDDRYEFRMDCMWTIEMPPNTVVNLTFESFDLEDSSNCRYDYLNVFDGDNNNFPLVGTFCGSFIPASFVSSGNFLTVHFVTDNSVNKRGFNATYRSVPMLCGGTLNATTAVQTLTSPHYPNAYPPFTSCRWILDAPAQESVKLSFQTFVLQPSQSCSTNYLEMKDWPVADAHPPDFYSYGRTVLVQFKSDAFMARNGVSFTYQMPAVAELMNSRSGYLKSPGWGLTSTRTTWTAPSS